MFNTSGKDRQRPARHREQPGRHRKKRDGTVVSPSPCRPRLSYGNAPVVAGDVSVNADRVPV
ncbi:hypothetical protein DPMN_039155 [Dreissena polymorpha]|uniref:Uncharacterized protein n=1 Tax=Dreissena polymorpha TaxID=45954 RepID=A0A9D4MHP2_DREPO|nr:hypothetical protein DPMN_039155 [Dreissena polymorpha]